MKFPHVSIVICSYNGAETLPRAILSLQQLDYPKDKLEIILVNDGSTDSTAEVGKSFGLKVINHDTNRGIPIARNSGLRQAKGEIYVCFDDDCYVKKDWLKQLMGGFQKDKNIVGVGGRIINPVTKNTADRYLQAINYGVPSPMIFNVGKNPLHRLAAFILDKASSVKKSKKAAGEYEVLELMAANSAFKKQVLLEVGGWDENLRWCSDVDISVRIRRLSSDNKFYFISKAEMIHARGLNLWQLIKRPYQRGPVVYQYYRKNGITPPLFPFPVIVILLVLAIGLYNPLLIIPALIVIPQIIYFWWPLGAGRNNNVRYFLFTYIELLSQACLLIGLGKGYIYSLNKGSSS